MRIIDKNNDYYDYLQDKEDNLVFDRRGSFVLTKQDILRAVNRRLNNFHRDPDNFMLLQCGATFWLIFVRGLDIEGERPNRRANDYSLRVVCSWKDYNALTKLLSLRFIDFNEAWKYDIWDRSFQGRSYEKEINEYKLMKEAQTLKDAVIHKEYRNVGALKGFEYREDLSDFGYPILKASGFPNLIDPTETYNAIDEYFSLMKTATEFTEAKGTTNDDKIKNHGFDTKTSFRGKV